MHLSLARRGAGAETLLAAEGADAARASSLDLSAVLAEMHSVERELATGAGTAHPQLVRTLPSRPLTPPLPPRPLTHAHDAGPGPGRPRARPHRAAARGQGARPAARRAEEREGAPGAVQSEAGARAAATATVAGVGLISGECV